MHWIAEAMIYVFFGLSILLMVLVVAAAYLIDPRTDEWESGDTTGYDRDPKGRF